MVQQERFTPGQTVAFKLRDAVCPRFADSVQAIGPELAVRGEIVFFSDGGEQKHHFAIIEVGGIHTPLIVPVDRLEAVVGTLAPSWGAAKEFPSAQATSAHAASAQELTAREPSRQAG